MSFGLDQYFKKQKKREEKDEKSEEKKTIEVVEAEGSDLRDWPSILEETVKSMVLYPHLLDYTRTNILPKRQSITPEELAVQLRVPLGVAIVLLDKLQHEGQETQ
ncbi:MAG: hypothetical protein ACFFBX_01340 [Promethearchaeota archaeon]